MPTYSAETYATLRNVRLLDEGELEGKRFVRCIPTRVGWRSDELTGEERRAIVQQAIREIGESGVVLANNPNYGGDYLRVETNTAVFRLICHMKS